VYCNGYFIQAQSHKKEVEKEILSDDFKKRKIFWKNIAENILENFPPHITSSNSKL
jgi:hypothetical protein